MAYSCHGAPTISSPIPDVTMCVLLVVGARHRAALLAATATHHWLTSHIPQRACACVPVVGDGHRSAC